MNELFQILLFIISISYKILLARKNVWGWILGATSSALSVLYIIIYLKLPLLMSLELAFLFLSLYGIYKYFRKIKYLTGIDYLIVIIAIFVIAYLLEKQLQSGTIWYEAIGSVSFLGGIVFLAQENKIQKIIGWLCFMSGSLSVGTVMFQKGVYILVALHIISLLVGIYAIVNINKKKDGLLL